MTDDANFGIISFYFLIFILEVPTARRQRGFRRRVGSFDGLRGYIIVIIIQQREQWQLLALATRIQLPSVVRYSRAGSVAIAHRRWPVVWRRKRIASRRCLASGSLIFGLVSAHAAALCASIDIVFGRR